MAVFRIERTKDYTVMSNHHLRNHELSLKAKGLLSMMLSLPDDWNYTTRGLAKICKEGVDAIGSALRELETAGYIVRNQLRDQQGRISDTEYRDVKQGSNEIKFVKPWVLPPVLYIHNRAWRKVYQLGKIFLCPPFCFPSFFYRYT